MSDALNAIVKHSTEEQMSDAIRSMPREGVEKLARALIGSRPLARLLKDVLVVMDGRPLYVPRFVRSQLELRGALGLPRGCAVIDEATGKPPGDEGGFEFEEGARFKTARGMEGLNQVLAAALEEAGIDPGTLEEREDWQSDPESWKEVQGE